MAPLPTPILTTHTAERGLRLWCGTCWSSLAIPASPDDVTWCDECQDRHPGSARTDPGDMALLRVWDASHQGPIRGEWTVINTVTHLHPN